MSNDLLKYAFVAGELSPSLYGRTDLTKYDLAMAEAYNFFVDYRGGLSSRPGTEFVDFLPDYKEGTDNGAAKPLDKIAPPFLFPHKIEADTEYNYLVVVTPINATGGDPSSFTFSHSIMLFIYNGTYAVESAFSISAITNADPAVFTAVGHDFVAGDWVRLDTVNFGSSLVEINNTTFIVRDVVGDTFKLEIVATGEFVDGTDLADQASPSAHIARLYAIECDYRPEDYARMCWQVVGSNGQGRDASIIRITHPDYPIRNLTWYYDGSIPGYEDTYGKGWELTDEVIGISEQGPTITTHTASAQPNDGPPLASVVFAVTAVYPGDIESIRGPAYKAENIVNYTVTAGSISIYWSPDPDAIYYNIYRSLVASTEVLTSGAELGFVGRTKSTKFTDPNIIPDFTRTPAKHNDPFSQRRVVRATIVDGGSGYDDFDTTLALTGSVGDGEGFIGEGVVDPDTGEIVNVIILNEGKNYNFPPTSTLTITGAGSGADITLVSSDEIGESLTYPAVNVIYQQRQLYAATTSRPVTIWGSQVGLFSNFDTTSNVVDSDAFEFDLNLDNFNYAPVRHLVATQVGLIAMTQESIWLVNGGGPTSPLTAQNTVATPQDYSGASLLRPLKVGSDIVFAEGKGYAVRALSYSEGARSFAAEDRSILSNHLIGGGKEIISWAYQEQPSKIIWCVRADGGLLAFTMVKSEEIYAWCSGGTKGQFLTVADMREATAKPTVQPAILDVVDSVYFVTQRKINGVWRRMIERMAQRQFYNLEDYWGLDCAVRNKGDQVNYPIYMDKKANGHWSLNSSSPTGVGAIGDLNWVVRAAGGSFRVTYEPDDGYDAEEIEPPKIFIPETNEESATAPRYQWTTTEPFDTLYGLWHLEGETVSVFADGKVLDDVVVTNGRVTLSTPVTRLLIGLPFTARAKSLPITVNGQAVEGKRKRTVGMAVRLENSKGLQAGQDVNSLYDVEPHGDPIIMRNGLHYELLSTSWDEDSSITFVQNKPLPVTMLSLITDVEVGDDSD